MNKNFWKTKTIKFYYKIYIKTLPIFLSCVFIICIAFIFIFKLYLIDIKEIFNNASRVGNIFYDLSLAYSASFIFYFITIHIKEQRDKTKINQIVGFETKRIIDNTKNFVIHAANHIKYTPKDAYPSKEELKDIFSKTNANDEIDVVYWSGTGLSKYNFINYLFLITIQNNELIKTIYEKKQFLCPDFIAILSKIENSSFSLEVNMLVGCPLKDVTLEAFDSLYYPYMQLIKKLEKYYNDKIKLFSLE